MGVRLLVYYTGNDNKELEKPVVTVDYKKHPGDLDWVPPDNPPWGKKDNHGNTSKGGVYRYEWVKI